MCQKSEEKPDLVSEHDVWSVKDEFYIHVLIMIMKNWIGISFAVEDL